MACRYFGLSRGLSPLKRGFMSTQVNRFLMLFFIEQLKEDMGIQGLAP